MKCLVVVVLLVAGSGAATGASTSCMLSEQFFARHNASADDSQEPGADGKIYVNICGLSG